MKNVDLIFRLILFGLFILPLELIAQLAVLTGRIYDSEKRTGIRQATVRLLDEQGAMILSISSGFNGIYLTDSIQPGTYYLEIAAEGFESLKMQPIRLFGNKSTIDIALNKVGNISAEAKDEVPDQKNEIPVVGIISKALNNYLTGGL